MDENRRLNAEIIGVLVFHSFNGTRNHRTVFTSNCSRTDGVGRSETLVSPQHQGETKTMFENGLLHISTVVLIIASGSALLTCYVLYKHTMLAKKVHQFHEGTQRRLVVLERAAKNLTHE